MYLGLRTTVFWNIFVLMSLAILLISIVVVRITEQQLFRQRTLAGQMVFASIAVSLARLIPGPKSDPPFPSDGQSLARQFIARGVCQELVLVDSTCAVLADTESRPAGRSSVDADLILALASDAPRTKIYQDKARLEPCLAITGPVYRDGARAGALKAVFPLQDVQQRIREASRIIRLYILVDGFILMAFGMFLLHRSLVRPINRLIRLTEHITEGNLDSTALFSAGRNEIGKLAAALRTMAARLKEERATIEQQVSRLEEKNRQLLQARREVIQAEKLASIGRLAAGIAHEIGNPLGIILGYMHLLRATPLDEGKRADYLGIIEAETERINLIIRDLLDYAQPSSRELQAVDLNKAIEDIYTLIAYQKEFNSITPIFHLAENLPPMLANEQLIKQLIVNLALNARDAMPAGGRLTFETACEASGPQPMICCTVTDTGVGIPPEHQEKIFDPFFTTKKQGKGTGLGLSNVHRIVELFGGRISLISSPGQGTTFTIRFPVMPPPGEHSA